MSAPVGLDVGTTGARAVAVDELGRRGRRRRFVIPASDAAAAMDRAVPGGVVVGNTAGPRRGCAASCGAGTSRSWGSDRGGRGLWRRAARAGAAGTFRDVEEATKVVRTLDTVTEPDPRTTATYDALYAVYRPLYAALREDMHRLGELAGS